MPRTVSRSAFFTARAAEGSPAWHVGGARGGSLPLALCGALALPLLTACVGGAAEPGARAPEAELDLESARRYLAALVAEERLRAELPTVTWEDEAAAAAETHAIDMATHGFSAHIGSDGSVPELRYTRAGGVRAVMENVGCVADARARPLVARPRFSREEVRALHRAFMDAGDGAHRRNILSEGHGTIGVGLARPEGVSRPCAAVVLGARGGRFAPLPKSAIVGDEIAVAGTFDTRVQAAFVSVARLPTRGATTAEALNRTGAYAPAAPHLTVRARVGEDGVTFEAEVVLDDARAAGVYAIGVWARSPDDREARLISLRTIDVR